MNISIYNQDNIMNDIPQLETQNLVSGEIIDYSDKKLEKYDLISEEIIDDSNKILFGTSILVIIGFIIYYRNYFQSFFFIPRINIEEQKRFYEKMKIKIQKNTQDLSEIEKSLKDILDSSLQTPLKKEDKKKIQNSLGEYNKLLRNVQQLLVQPQLSTVELIKKLLNNISNQILFLDIEIIVEIEAINSLGLNDYLPLINLKNQYKNFQTTILQIQQEIHSQEIQSQEIQSQENMVETEKQRILKVKGIEKQIKENELYLLAIKNLLKIKSWAINYNKDQLQLYEKAIDSVQLLEIKRYIGYLADNPHDRYQNLLNDILYQISFLEENIELIARKKNIHSQNQLYLISTEIQIQYKNFLTIIWQIQQEIQGNMETEEQRILYKGIEKKIKDNELYLLKIASLIANNQALNNQALQYRCLFGIKVWINNIINNNNNNNNNQVLESTLLEIGGYIEDLRNNQYGNQYDSFLNDIKKQENSYAEIEKKISENNKIILKIQNFLDQCNLDPNETHDIKKNLLEIQKLLNNYTQNSSEYQNLLKDIKKQRDYRLKLRRNIPFSTEKDEKKIIFCQDITKQIKKKISKIIEDLNKCNALLNKITFKIQVVLPKKEFSSDTITEVNAKQEKLKILFMNFLEDYILIKKEITTNYTRLNLQVTESLSFPEYTEIIDKYYDLSKDLFKYSQTLYFLKIYIKNIFILINKKKKNFIVFDKDVYQKSFHWIYYLNDQYIQNVVSKFIRGSEKEITKIERNIEQYDVYIKNKFLSPYVLVQLYLKSKAKKNLQICHQQKIARKDFLSYLKDQNNNLEQFQIGLYKGFDSKLSIFERFQNDNQSIQYLANNVSHFLARFKIGSKYRS